MADLSAFAGEYVYQQGEEYKSYHIWLDGSGLHYSQQLASGNINGHFLEFEDGDYKARAQLDNGALIRAYFPPGRCVTSYSKDGSKWSVPTFASKKEEPQQHAPGMQPRWVRVPPDPNRQRPRGRRPPAVDLGPLADRIHGTVLGALVDSDDEGDPTSFGGALRSWTRRALADIHARDVPRDSTSHSFFEVIQDLPMARFMDEDILEEFQAKHKARVDPKQTIQAIPAVRMIKGTSHPLSYNEEQMLRMYVSDPRNTGYKIFDVIPPQTGFHDPRLIEAAYMMVTERHDVLRCCFTMDEGNNAFRTVEHIGRDNPVESFLLCTTWESDIGRVFAMNMHVPNKLGLSSVRFNTMISHLKGPHVAYSMHHICFDGESNGLFRNEHSVFLSGLTSGYSAEAIRQSEYMPALPCQYIDFAYWQRSNQAQGTFDPELAYWVQELVCCCPPMVLDIPIDNPRPRMFQAVGNSLKFPCDVSIVSPVQEASMRATPFAVVMANFCTCLCRVNGQQYVDMATPFGLRALAALANCIGDFVNMISMRIKHDPTEPFTKVVDRSAISAINLQRYPFAPLIKISEATRKFYHNDPSRNPMYQSMVDMTENPSEQPNKSMLGILDMFMFASTRNNALWCVDYTYNTTILSEVTVNLIAMQFQNLSYFVAKNPHDILPRELDFREKGQPPNSGNGLELKRLIFSNGALPQVVTLKSGWSAPATSFFDMRNSHRMKRVSGLELWTATGLDGLKPKEHARAAEPKPGQQRPYTAKEMEEKKVKDARDAAEKKAKEEQEAKAKKEEEAKAKAAAEAEALKVAEEREAIQDAQATELAIVRDNDEESIKSASTSAKQSEPAKSLDPEEEARRVEVERCLAKAQRIQAVHVRQTETVKLATVDFDSWDSAQRQRPAGVGRRGARRGR